MAKLRTNHDRNAKSSGGMIVKVGIFSAIIGALFMVFNKFSGSWTAEEEATQEEQHYLPFSNTNSIIRHKYFTLAYSEEHEQAAWVAYQLKKEEVEAEWVDRSDDFRADEAISTGSATPEDYKGSGYDRGHLVPAADRAFSEEAMYETFLMSNISPQARNFNKGIWRELEELTRSWAKKNGALYVITGPILSVRPKGQIGDNEVSVPEAYFKVLLDLSEPELKGIGFMVPNQVCFDPLYKYAFSIDEVEAATGIDFFPELMPKDLEESLESNLNIDLWEFSKKKFEDRVEKWNNQ
ncbi:MAG TPA: DNA/RNA non-specific endonuclease [Saprospiraceae bacterium]|nr:DNA/RNA non-specific endonuclease [Saprospiraceae bacterium]HMQ81843.1 DNA/RNA non-specific endonuclease [Saprospiraceae bacterium]